jgi:hypothetical protein
VHWECGGISAVLSLSSELFFLHFFVSLQWLLVIPKFLAYLERLAALWRGDSLYLKPSADGAV